jgi:CRISPR-associated endonuclease/helicase Cas3
MPNLKTSQGETISDEMLEALSAEAEAGYDPATLQPRRTGRPALGTGPSRRVQFRVSPTVYQLAMERARKEHRTLSDVARGLLEEYGRRDNTPPQRRRTPST